MTYSTSTMIIWIVLAVSLSWILPRKLQLLSIIAVGITFLGLASLTSLVILTLSSLFTFWLSTFRSKRGLAIISTILLLSLLFVAYKTRYSISHGSLAIPIGLSYYVFRMIHYSFEAYKRKLRRHSFIEFMAYLFLMPPLIVGPIHRFPEFLNDYRRRHFDWDRFSKGIERVFYGYVKLIILANYLVTVHLQQFTISLPIDAFPFLIQFLEALVFWIGLYLRFSAYSDIAIGASTMMGFTIIENFYFPFLAQNISEFWRRWHISLTSWCRDYIYKPVAALTRRPNIALFVTMLVIGLWHSFSIKYIIWGLYHAGGIVVQQRWSKFRPSLYQFKSSFMLKTERISATVLTILFVVCSFAVTNRAQSFILEIIGGF